MILHKSCHDMMDFQGPTKGHFPFPRYQFQIMSNRFIFSDNKRNMF